MKTAEKIIIHYCYLSVNDNVNVNDAPHYIGQRCEKSLSTFPLPELNKIKLCKLI